MSARFVHLRVQSSYSMLESTLKIEKILELAVDRRNRTPAVALTDRNNLFGSLEFSIEAVKRGIQPIHGVILNIQYYDKGDVAKYAEILLIAQDEEGYKNLLQLSSFPYIKNDRTVADHITLEDLFIYNKGIIVLSAYLYGIIGVLLSEEKFLLAEEYANKIKEVFGDRFYFEIMRINEKQIYVIEEKYVKLAEKLSIPLVATNNVLFEGPENYFTHEILMKICSSNKSIAESDNLRVNNQCYFKSPDEIIEIFWDLPQAVENTVYLAKRVSFILETQEPSFPAFAENFIEENRIIRQMSEEGLLQRLKDKFHDNVVSKEEFESYRKLYFDRLYYELDIICKMNFSGYFLIVSDFIKWSKRNNIFVGPGRGSSAGSIVAWSLSITDLDPIKFGLLFERFLNPERVSMPDFDIDFCQERREEVINYVKDKYGEKRVGQIITFGKMQAKAVIKDVARVLGLSYNYANYITALIPFNAINPVTLREAIDKVTELYNAYVGKGLYNFESLVKIDSKYLKLVDKWENHSYPKIDSIIDQYLDNVNLKEEFAGWKKKYNYENIIKSDLLYQEVIGKCKKFNLTNLEVEFEQIKDEYNNLVSSRIAQIQNVIRVALELEGLHRHVSIHAAGIVIGRKDLVEILPLYKDKDSEMQVVQYSMKYSELIGLVKFDFLGLQTLTIISKCLELLKSRGINLDVNKLEFNDIATYKMLSKGDATGVFQFESIGMKDTLKRLRPDCIEDLMALGALYRPGPMDNIPTYISCKHKKLKPDYLHAKLEPILKETYGVIIYQEQVIEIARILAKYTLGSADLLRRAMGKKIKSEMNNQKAIFIKGALENGINNVQAEKIFTEVAKFAGYGFNKSHAAAYAVISYQTAYLKANYPTEFLVACLNLDINDQDKINLFIQEAKKIGIRIIFPDINNSSEYFTIAANNTIVFALGAIKNVTPNIGRFIVGERLNGGKFKSILDFVERMSTHLINKKTLESLILAGCFDSVHSSLSRRQLFESIDRINSYAVSRNREKKTSQFSFINNELEDIIVTAPEYYLSEKAIKEFEVLGVFLTCHPISSYESFFSRKGIVSSEYIKKDLPFGNSIIKIAGVIQKKDSRMSAKGKFNTIKLSDSYGNFEITIFNEEILRKYGSLLEVGSLVIAKCEVFKDEGGIRITAVAFEDIKLLERDTSYSLKLMVHNKKDLKDVMQILKSQTNNKSNTKIDLILPFLNKEFQVIVSIPFTFMLTSDQMGNLERFMVGYE